MHSLYSAINKNILVVVIYRGSNVSFLNQRGDSGPIKEFHDGESDRVK